MNCLYCERTTNNHKEWCPDQKNTLSLKEKLKIIKEAQENAEKIIKDITPLWDSKERARQESSGKGD